MRLWIALGGLGLFATLVVVLSEMRNAPAAPKAPAPKNSTAPTTAAHPNPAAPLPAPSVVLDVPAAPAADASPEQVKQYMDDLEKIIRDPAQPHRKEAMDAKRGLSREQRDKLAKAHREDSDKRREQLKQEREQRDAERLQGHNMPPRNGPDASPLFAPPAMGPPVTGVKEPTPSPAAK